MLLGLAPLFKTRSHIFAISHKILKHTDGVLLMALYGGKYEKEKKEKQMLH